jgi:hypothetical protein
LTPDVPHVDLVDDVFIQEAEPQNINNFSQEKNFSQQRRIKHVFNGVRDEELPRIADEIE